MTKHATKPLRCLWPALFEPNRWSEEKGKDYWDVVLLLDKKEDAEEIKKLASAIKEAVVEEFGNVAVRGLEQPLKDGDETHPGDALYEGKMHCRFKSYSKPQCIAAHRIGGKPVFFTDADKDAIYGGCWIRVIYEPKAATHGKSGTKYVTCFLDTVQKTKDDDVLTGNRTSSAEQLEELLDFEDEPLESIEDLLS